MSQGDITRIKNFVSAGTPQGLRRAMLRNNGMKGVAFIYDDVQFVNGKWYAWYHEVLGAQAALAEGSE